MASSKTNWYAQALLRNSFRAVALALPTTWYIAASTAAFDPTLVPGVPGAAAVAGVFPEAPGAGYARAPVARTGGRWSLVELANGLMQVSNSAQILFGGATAAWLPVVSLYLCDAETGGNAYYGGDLPASVIVPAGETLALPAGAAKFTER